MIIRKGMLIMKSVNAMVNQDADDIYTDYNNYQSDCDSI